MRIRAVVLLGLLFSIALPAEAQRRYRPYRYYRPGGYYNYDYGPYGGTMTPGLARSLGLSELIRAKGDYLKDEQEARSEAAEARKKEAEAQERVVESYYEKRRMRDQYNQEKLAEANERLSKMQNRSLSRTPDRLGPGDLDPLTGQIDWPAELRREPFDAPRQAIDEIVARSGSGPGLQQVDYIEIDRYLTAMETELKSHIKDWPTSEYIAASQFLKSLAYSLQNPTT